MCDMSAVVVVSSLSASICSLLSADGGAEASVKKAQLRTMRDATFKWPSLDEVRPDALPPLSKNIAKNFTGTVFKTSGRDLVQAEVERLQKQVLYCAYFFRDFALFGS